MPERLPVPHADLELVRRALAGEAAAADAVVEQLRCVYRILSQRNGRMGEPFGASELEDLAQEVMIAVWSKLAGFEGRSSLQGWIYRFAQLEMIYRLRRKDRGPQLLEDLRPGLEGGLEGPETRELDQADELYTALEQLDPAQAEVIRLKHFEGLTFQESAARLGAGVNTAKTRYYRGLQRLREILLRGRTKVWEGIR